MARLWKPSVTVAALIEREGRFLMVREQTADGLRLNQPAGHLDPGESLVQAVAREALEETAHRVRPEHLVGIYMARYQRQRKPADLQEDPDADSSGTVDVTFLRFAFACRVEATEAGRALDEGIVEAVWLTPEQIRACRAMHRSELVLRSLEDHLAGCRQGLDLIHTDPACIYPFGQGGQS